MVGKGTVVEINGAVPLVASGRDSTLPFTVVVETYVRVSWLTTTTTVTTAARIRSVEINAK